MSTITVNGSNISVDAKAGTPIGSVLDKCAEQIIPNGQVVRKIAVDGVERDIEELRWGEFDELSLRTSHPFDLVIDGLQSSEVVSAGVVEELSQAAEQLRLGQQEGFGGIFVKAVDNMLSMLRFMGLAVAHMQEHGQLVEEYRNRLENIIGQVFEAQKSEDWVLMADQIECELVPLFQHWPEVSKEVCKELSGILSDSKVSAATA